MQLWEVVGGGDKGGILVREEQSLKSPEHTERLATGALVRERELIGERLHFEKLSGSGPMSGWVSLRLKGKDLVAKSDKTAPLQPLGPSKWVARYKHMPTARCRLLCAFGAGTDANTFGEWNKVVKDKYPDVEIVLLQLPGRGSHRGVELEKDSTEAARHIAEELDRLGIACSPANLALFGFSIGATLCFSLSLELERRGWPPLRLYVAGRAGPSIEYSDPDGAMAADYSDPNPCAYIRRFIKSFVGPEDSDKVEKLISLTEDPKTDAMLNGIRKMQCMDLELGNSLVSTAVPTPQVACDIFVSASDGDTCWPARDSTVNGVYCVPPYEDIASTWQPYTSGTVIAKVVDGVPHFKLCAETLLDTVCSDLRSLLSTESKA